MFRPSTSPWKNPRAIVAQGSHLATSQWDVHKAKQAHKGGQRFDALFIDALRFWKGNFEHDFHQQQDRNHSEPSQPQFKRHLSQLLAARKDHSAGAEGDQSSRSGVLHVCDSLGSLLCA
jgi:hypothetical protein